MEDTKERLAYLGKYVDEMTKEELLDVVYLLYKMYDDEVKESHRLNMKIADNMKDMIKLKFG